MTCKECFHYNACSGFTPTDLDQDVFDYCRKGIADEIPDIEERCSCFLSSSDVVEVVRCKDCKHCSKLEKIIPVCSHEKNVLITESAPKRVHMLVVDNYHYCSYGERCGDENKTC